jgi:hypothetical protein
VRRVNDVSANAFRELQYLNAEGVLRDLDLPGLTLRLAANPEPPHLLSSRETRRQLEILQGCLFAYGLGQRMQRQFAFARDEACDHDGVIYWSENEIACFSPVQLKELVPAELNANATLAAEIEKLRPPRYDNMELTVALHVNRTGEMRPLELDVRNLRLAGLYLVFAVDHEQRQWGLCGDLLDHPTTSYFRYPD